MKELTSKQSSTSLLGDNQQPWGYPAWIQEDEKSHSTTSMTLKRSLTSLFPLQHKSHMTLTEDGPPKDKNIYNLTAQDIKLLVCFGDSLLSGLCLTAHPGSVKNQILSVLTSKGFSNYIPWVISAEHRQNTCISGGGKGVLSVGKLLHKYSPDLVGLDCQKTNLGSKGSGFNFSRTGACSDNLLEQIHSCVQKTNSKEFQHLKIQWKLCFIWIGANDVFTKSEDYLNTQFKKNVLKSLQALKATLSKAIVYIVTLPDLSLVHNHAIKLDAETLKARVLLVNEILGDIVNKYQWNEVDYFRVILQPVAFDIPSIENISWVSPLDHIHPSFYAQQIFAKSLWNNLFLDPRRKLSSSEDIINSEWIEPGSDQFLT